MFREADNKRDTLRKQAKHGKLIHQICCGFFTMTKLSLFISLKYEKWCHHVLHKRHPFIIKMTTAASHIVDQRSGRKATKMSGMQPLQNDR